MWRKIAVTLGLFSLAFVILLISVLRTASVKYEFNSKISNERKARDVLGDKTIDINYNLAYPGRVLPDNPLWSVKALRDKVWLFLTTNPGRRAELNLLFADKRLGASYDLFKKGKPELGYTVLSKAEKYLEEASFQERENRKKGIDTEEFLERIALASLKHYELMNEILEISPDDAKPKVIESQAYAKDVYKSSMNALNEKGKTPPENPFDW